jgi:hypothetical protein
MSTRRPLLAALAFAAGLTLSLGFATVAGATITPVPVPQFIIHFTAISRPADPTTGLQFRSTSCAIGPATHPIVVPCQETGHIVFSSIGGSGSASLSSVLAGINWTFSLARASATTATTYAMSGTGTESTGTTPVRRPVRVTGQITVLPSPDPTLGPVVKGTENIYPLPFPPASRAQPETAPVIVANPNNLMVNTNTILGGRHFHPHTTIHLVECSRTSWVVVAQKPCDTNNTVTLTTSAAGSFTTRFKAELCPQATRVGPTAVRCYIGIPKPSGIDTVTLQAAVAITVTYP